MTIYDHNDHFNDHHVSEIQAIVHQTTQWLACKFLAHNSVNYFCAHWPASTSHATQRA
jgi:hypothetical protein